MATPPSNPAVQPAQPTPPAQAVVKKPTTPTTLAGKLDGLDKAYEAMLEAKKDAKNPLNEIGDPRTGTAKSREEAYTALYSATARFYRALHSTIGIGPDLEHPTLGVGPNPDKLTAQEELVAGLPNLGLSPATQTEASAMKEIIGKNSWRGWFQNALTGAGGTNAYFGSEHELGTDRLVAKHLDKERKRLQIELYERVQALPKAIAAEQDPAKIALLQQELAEGEAYLEENHIDAKNYKKKHPDSFEKLVKANDDALDVCDAYLLERIQRGSRIGWGNESEHDLKRKRDFDMFAVFDHAGCKVFAGFDSKGNATASINRLSMFSQASAFMGMGQMLGALKEQLIYKLPVYEYETEKDPLTQTETIKKDKDGNPIVKKDEKTGKSVIAKDKNTGKEKYRYGDGKYDEAFKLPITLNSVPSGWASEGVKSLVNATVWAEKLGTSLTGANYSEKGEFLGYDPEYINRLAENMPPGVRDDFKNQMQNGDWKARRARAEAMFDKEVLNPYFDNLARAQLKAEKNSDYLQLKGTQSKMGWGGWLWSKVTDSRKNWYKHLDTFNSAVNARAQEIRQAMQAHPDDAQKNMHYIARQAVMKMGGHPGGPSENQEIKEGLEPNTETMNIVNENKENEADARISVIASGEKPSQFSAMAKSSNSAPSAISAQTQSSSNITNSSQTSPAAAAKVGKSAEEELQNKLEAARSEGITTPENGGSPAPKSDRNGIYSADPSKNSNK